MNKDIMKSLKKMPLIQTKVRRIKGTRLILHQVIISDIRPAEYYEAVVDEENKRMETDIDIM